MGKSTPAILFASQAVLYCVICINTRAISQIDYTAAVLSDFAIASINFLVFRHIATTADTTKSWVAYVAGSLVGTVAGIRLSESITQ